MKELRVALLHEEVQLMARVLLQLCDLMGAAQSGPLGQELECAPEGLLLPASLGLTVL